jgi:aspartyl-tRNA(Asn)/glutamyl-tRNA(Gln) amidotransferase subunit A
VITDEPTDLGVLEIAAQLRGGALSASELTEACLRRIDERNGGPPSFDGAPDAINAWVRLYPELARSAARRADERRARERADTPLLCGVPLALKDVYGIAGLPVTASSGVLAGNVAAADASAWARLRDQGMVPLGHTHTHEFAAGKTTDQVGNPWALDRVVGGSSGGNAAALAARMVPAAVGTDTCGSLRIPAACCGTSAIKPGRGRVPIAGLVPLAPSLDHPGPMARTIADCAALLTAMAGGEPVSTPLMPP